MCRLACEIIMGLKRLRHKLAERQHGQTLPGLDIRLPSLHMCPGVDWMKRCSSSSGGGETLAIAQEQELVDSGISEEDCDSSPLVKCESESLGSVVAMPGMKIDTVHSANSTLEGGVAAAGMAGPRFNSDSALNAATFDAAHVFKQRNEAVGEEEAFRRPSNRGFETAAGICKDEFMNDEKLATLNDYLTECWDEDLEDAIIRCSDASNLESKFEKAGIVNPKVELVVSAAMPDMRCEPTHMATCRYDLDGATVSFSNVTEASGVSKLAAASNMTSESSFNASQFSSHLQEDFVTDSTRMDNELSGDGHFDNRPLKFSQQQMDVLEAVARGKSVFITGSAGTGKSFLLKYIIRMLKKAVGKGAVYVTASTGLAACALNGTTLHYFAGIGLGSGTPEYLVRRVSRSKESSKRWRTAEVLIIDEISMIDGELFDKLEYVARIVRQSASCFGGIQLIVTGDFFQLPPVNPPNRRKYFAFQADCWHKCFDLQVELEHVFRQSDTTFIKMLNEIRKGVQTPETLKNLTMCLRALPDDGSDISPTRLYPLKVDVKLENMQELKALQTNTITFHSVDSSPNPLHRYMLDSMRAEKELQLCVGAQVMLIKNIDTCGGLVNGAKGVVVGFQSTCALVEEKDEELKQVKAVAHVVSPDNLWPVVRFDCGVIIIGPKKENAEDGGVEVVSRIQVPLILAWALSVHKCQGMTLSKVQTDLSKAFDFGMVYVALSRVKDLDGLQLIGFDPTRIKVHPDVLTFFDKLVEKV